MEQSDQVGPLDRAALESSGSGPSSLRVQALHGHVCAVVPGGPWGLAPGPLQELLENGVGCAHDLPLRLDPAGLPARHFI